jgi:hypothetical protein
VYQVSEEKNAEKFLFYVQNCVRKTILKIPWDSRSIQGKLWGFHCF